ncbi:hypothetical protein V8E36_004262, partial [Tilletia maclaganii]
IFWFGLGQVAGGFTSMAGNCGSNFRGCLVGGLQAIFGAAVTAGAAGYATYYSQWKRSDDGIYHLYETVDFKATGLHTLVDGAKTPLQILKDVHVGKEQEATMIFHHTDGTKRQMLYHFNNDTQLHMLYASFHSVQEHEELYPNHLQARVVNDGFGAAFHDMDTGDWANVDHGSNDIAYWTSHSLDQLQDNNADSFCMGCNDPTRNGEAVGAMRLQPANGGDYGGVNYDTCGGDSFRRRK